MHVSKLVDFFLVLAPNTVEKSDSFASHFSLAVTGLSGHLRVLLIYNQSKMIEISFYNAVALYLWQAILSNVRKIYCLIDI